MEQNTFYVNLLKRGYDVATINQLWNDIAPKKVLKQKVPKLPKASMPVPQYVVAKKQPKAKKPKKQQGVGTWRQFLQAHKSEMANYASLGEFTKAMSELYRQPAEAEEPEYNEEEIIEA